MVLEALSRTTIHSRSSDILRDKLVNYVVHSPSLLDGRCASTNALAAGSRAGWIMGLLNDESVD